MPISTIPAEGLSPGAAMPAGAVIFVAMNTAPDGYLKANGAAISRTTYAALFSAIGTTFGVGDGSTTFNVPDMRGQFARGWVDNGSVDSGRAFGSTQTDQFQGHWHGGVINTSGVAVTYTGTGAFGDTLKTGDPVTGSNGAVRFGNETRPVNVALLACIKY
jgi:microcystin-dependent protein